MRHRVFYIVHLDRKRIFFLSFTFLSLLLFSFALGRYLAQAQIGQKEVERFPLFYPTEASKDQKKEETPLAKNEGDAKTRRQEVVLLLEDEASKRDSSLSSKIRQSPLSQVPVPNKARPKAQLLIPKALKKKSKTSTSSIKKREKNANSPPFSKQRSRTQKIKKASPKKILLSKSLSNKKKKTKNSKKANPQKKKLLLSNIIKRPLSKTEPSSYYLQLGAFRSQDAARRMRKELRRQGFAAHIKEKENMYLVRVGQSASLREIKKTEDHLREKKYFPIRVKEI